MKRYLTAVLGLGMLALAAGCCCHRGMNPCPPSPCGPVGYGYNAPMGSPVAYAPPTMAAAPCVNCAPATF